jgi:hypothetical protein
MGCEDMNVSEMAQNQVQWWWALVLVMPKLQVRLQESQQMVFLEKGTQF